MARNLSTPEARQKYREYQKRWREKNSAKCSAYSLKWRTKNLEQVRARDRELHKGKYKERIQENRRKRAKELAAWQKAWRKKNHAKCLERDRLYRLNNQESVQQSQKRYADKNKPKLAAKARRRRSTPRGIIETRLRGRLAALVRERRAVRVGRSEELVGCSYEDLVGYIEKQFKPGMSWNNRSEWHVDHKTPCAAFDLLTIEGQRACFHYTNLQPLWAEENRRKHSKIIPFRIAA